MKWKGIIPVISVAAMVGGLSSNLVSANIGDTSGENFLNNIKDFDWTDKRFGDGIEYKNENPDAVVKQLDVLSAINKYAAQNIETKNENKGRYLDYSKFNTWFQSKDGIKKQAVTGVPLNFGFLPNGNKPSDFGVTSKARQFSSFNSILDWNEKEDMDARYNRSYVPLRKSTPTAFAYPKSSPKANSKIKFNLLGHSTREQSTFDNTLVGVKNPVEGTNLNWQYTNIFVNWSGSIDTGIIIPPSGDIIDMAHNNGSLAYGNIFLDGFHGLTRQMLKDFIKTDDEGNYFVVDFLLYLAEYLGFDGYFFNDESNGFLPNGFVIDHDIVIEIIKQFNEKSVKNNLNKKMIYYKSWDTLTKNGLGKNDYVDIETYKASKTNVGNFITDIQLDFPNMAKDIETFYIENNLYGKNREDVSTMLELGWNMWNFGNYDWREKVYDTTITKDGELQYDNKQYNSVSGFTDNGALSFSNAALDIYNANEKHLANISKDKIKKFVFANQVSNLYNDILFNGTNTNQTIDDRGLTKNEEVQAYNNEQDLGNILGVTLGTDGPKKFVLSDPRIDFDWKENEKPGESKNPDKSLTDGDAPAMMKAIKNYVYNFDQDGNNGRNTTSYGVGNLITEKTVLEDIDNNSPSIKTNFSTGSGVKFVDKVNDDLVTTGNYPYTNRRIADILPTYQWDINEIENGTDVSTVDPLRMDKTKIDELNGFYDYYDVYKKSNSIVIGSKFDTEGNVEPGKWDLGKQYIWNIMGTNISKNNHEFSITYNDGSKDGSNATVTPLVTMTKDGELNSYSDKTTIKSTTTTLSTDGKSNWTTIKFSLNDISDQSKLSRIGLKITPLKENFKLNVGELTMDYNDEDNPSVEKNLINFNNEYRIERNDFVNLRFAYDTNLSLNNFDYIVFYIKEAGADKWYRVGETKAKEYFIKDIDKKTFGEKIELAALTYKNNKIVGSDRFSIE